MAAILMYHGVDHIENLDFNNRFFSFRHIEEQLIFFKNNYKLINIQQAFEQDYINDPRSICLTFDDGYENNFNLLYPLLVKHNVPAAIYITGINKSKNNILWADLVDLATPSLPSLIEVFNEKFIKNEVGKFVNLKKHIKKSPIGGTQKFQELLDVILQYSGDFREDKSYDLYWKLLTDEQIKALASDDLITIGSHAYWHNNLSNLPKTLAAKEINESLSYLSNITGHKIRTIAFPDGSYNNDTLDICVENGIDWMLGSHYLNVLGVPKSKLQHRLGIYPPDSKDEINFKLKNYIKLIGER